MQKSNPFRIIVFGTQSEFDLNKVLPEGSVIQNAEYDIDKLAEGEVPAAELVICFPPMDKSISMLELAQLLRMSYAESLIYFLVLRREDFEKKKIVKNGFDNAFLLPWESSELQQSLGEAALYSKLPELKDYAPVKVLDIVAEKVLDFGTKIYLPFNNKLVTIGRSGEPISTDKLKMLNEGSYGTVFVHKSELSNFHDYTKKVLTEIGQIESETVRQEKMRTAVRELVSDLFVDDVQENTFGKSKAIVEELSKTVSAMMKEQYSVIMKKMESLLNEEYSFYRHLSNVSTYSMIFSMAMGLEKPQEVAVAGVLHDVGKTALPLEVANCDEKEMSPHALKAYQKHPQLTIDVIKMKRVPLPERITKAILQHHERCDGSGYPVGLSSSRICIEAKILGIADEFDYLTSLQPGRTKMTPKEALDHLIKENGSNPSMMKIDVDILLTLREVLIEGKITKKEEKNAKQSPF